MQANDDNWNNKFGASYETISYEVVRTLNALLYIVKLVESEVHVGYFPPIFL